MCNQPIPWGGWSRHVNPRLKWPPCHRNVERWAVALSSMILMEGRMWGRLMCTYTYSHRFFTYTYLYISAIKDLFPNEKTIFIKMHISWFCNIINEKLHKRLFQKISQTAWMSKIITKHLKNVIQHDIT